MIFSRSCHLQSPATTFTLTHDTYSTSQWMAVAVFAARQRPPGAPGRLHRAEGLRPRTMLTAPKAMPYSASLRCCQRLVLVRHLGYASTDRTASCGVKGFASGIAEVANPTETRQSPVFATNVTRTTCVSTTFVLCHTTCRAPQKMLAAKQTEADCLSPACWSQQSLEEASTNDWNMEHSRSQLSARRHQQTTRDIVPSATLLSAECPGFIMEPCHALQVCVTVCRSGQNPCRSCGPSGLDRGKTA